MNPDICTCTPMEDGDGYQPPLEGCPEHTLPAAVLTDNGDIPAAQPGMAFFRRHHGAFHLDSEVI